MSACGEKLPNFGQRQLKVWTNENNLAVATFRCAVATRPLCSVSTICDQGIRVVFECQGSFIRSPNGARTSFKRENNVYVLEMHAKEPGLQGSGFAWPSNIERSSSWRARNTDLYFNIRWAAMIMDEQAGKDEEQAGGDEPGEALDPLRRRVCRQPTPAEVRVHKLMHLPFREWCSECVAGAANDHPHRTQPAEIRELLGQSLRCTGITASRPTPTGTGMLSCWFEEIKRQG